MSLRPTSQIPFPRKTLVPRNSLAPLLHFPSISEYTETTSPAFITGERKERTFLTIFYLAWEHWSNHWGHLLGPALQPYVLARKHFRSGLALEHGYSTHTLGSISYDLKKKYISIFQHSKEKTPQYSIHKRHIVIQSGLYWKSGKGKEVLGTYACRFFQTCRTKSFSLLQNTFLHMNSYDFNFFHLHLPDLRHGFPQLPET